MTSKFKFLIVLLAGAAFAYSGCKKSATKPSGPQLTPSQVASQAALTISQSLFGGLGAFDVSGGLSAPSTLAVHQGGKVIDDLTNPECGTTVDTTMTANLTSGDSTISINGTLKFSFACTNGVLSSYTTSDNVVIGFSGGSTKFSYSVGENFTVAAVTPGSQTSNISLNGSLNSNASYQNLGGSSGSGTSIFDYTLKSIIIAGDGSGTLISGSAAFTTSGTGPRGVWNYSGTIVFQGSTSALVTINGTTYTVNLLTGATS